METYGDILSTVMIYGNYDNLRLSLSLYVAEFFTMEKTLSEDAPQSYYNILEIFWIVLGISCGNF